MNKLPVTHQLIVDHCKDVILHAKSQMILIADKRAAKIIAESIPSHGITGKE